MTLPTLLILRGITGAGKTTLGVRLAGPPYGFYVMELDELKAEIHATDRNWIRQFSEGSVLEKAEAVRQAARGFSIARNFPKCELEGAAKHFRTVEELDATNPDHVGDSIHNA